MTGEQKIGVGLVVWAVLSVPLGVLVGKFIKRGKGL